MRLCPICLYPCTRYVPRYSIFEIDCIRCGYYSIKRHKGEHRASLIPFAERHHLDDRQRANISGYIREHQELLINDANTSHLRKLRTPAVEQRGTKVLLAMARTKPNPGELCHIPHASFDDHFLKVSSNYVSILCGESADDIPIKELAIPAFWIGTAWAVSGRELGFIIQDGLVEDGLVKNIGDTDSVVITPKGWRRIEELTSNETEC